MAYSPIIGISFEAMDELKKKLHNARIAAEGEREYLIKAINALQVDDWRLRQKSEELRAMRTKIENRINELQRLEAHIDHVVKRFKEVDRECAKRISSRSYESKRVLGLSEASETYGILYGGMLSMGVQGARAWQKYNKNPLDRYTFGYGSSNSQFLLDGKSAWERYNKSRNGNSGNFFTDMANSLWKPSEFTWTRDGIDWTEDAIKQGWGPVTKEEYNRRKALLYILNYKKFITIKDDKIDNKRLNNNNPFGDKFLISYEDAEKAGLISKIGNSSKTEFKGFGGQVAATASIPIWSAGAGAEVIWFTSDNFDRTREGLYSSDSKLIPYIYVYGEVDSGVGLSKQAEKYLKDSFKDMALGNKNVMLKNVWNQTGIKRPEFSASGFAIVGNENFNSPYDYLGESKTFSITLPVFETGGLKISTSNNEGRCRTIGAGISSNMFGFSSGTSNYYMLNPKYVDSLIKYANNK